MQGLILLVFCALAWGQSIFKVGVGRADITSPIGEVNTAGYDDLGVNSDGIHLRLKARAFVFAGTNNQRVVFVSVDLGKFSALNSHRMKELVVSGLHDALGAAGTQYTLENIMISATHTHAGPGGYNDDFLYQALTLGFISETRNTIANGVVAAIVQAHNQIASQTEASTVFLNKGPVDNASINRSNKSYLNNPAEERALYSKNIDNWMTELVVKNSVGLQGALNWFPVHGTSMNNNNSYVSGDNKGYAAYMWELEQAQNGNPSFVAAFAQTNAGDVTPNTIAPTCIDSGLPCDGSVGDCNGHPTYCEGHGPGWDVGKDDFYSTSVIGGIQFAAAKAIASNSTPLFADISGPVSYRHAFLDFSSVQVKLDNGSTVSTCSPAMGFSFAGATTDGIGSSIFPGQGVNYTDAATQWYWNILTDIAKLGIVTDAEKACHYPKVILLDTGEMPLPYHWQPKVLPFQMFLIGRKFAIIAIPTEITTMAGRRLRNSTLTALINGGSVDEDAVIVIAGLSNTYVSYTTTYEEYQIQRYEGGSTAYGPYQLKAMQQIFNQMAASFGGGANVTSLASMAENFTEWQLLPGVVLDTTPIGSSFGNVLTAPNTTYHVGQTASAVFQCAHPRTGTGYTDPASGIPTFMTVDKQIAGNWTTFLTDAGWDTKYLWKRVGTSDSTCQLDWSIGETVPAAAGVYRFSIYFAAKPWYGQTNFVAHTGAFTVA
ncbi:hypothetical protein HDU84_004036 [Entophlyctis sp. JEL0112]|nr:hypothetical protein HDU84_004036 [Entophlyctis sp. JEL0112]